MHTCQPLFFWHNHYINPIALDVLSAVGSVQGPELILLLLQKGS